LKTTDKISNVIYYLRNNAVLLFAFSLPLHRLLSSYALALWALVSIILLFYKKKETKPQNRKQYIHLLLLPLLFLLYLLGLTYSEGIDEAFIKINISIVYLFLPFVFYKSREYINIRKVLLSFIYGLLLSISILLIIFLISPVDINLDSFYTSFSIFHPQAYFAMMITIAIGSILFINEEIRFNVPIRLLLIGLLSIIVFLISSKSGLICILLILFIKLIQVFIQSRNTILKLSLSIVLLIISVLLINNSRFQDMITNIKNLSKSDTALHPTESTSSRVAIWRSSVEMIKESPIFGYGTGDANAALMESYKRDALMLRHVIERKYNAHNTFFQLWLMVGVLGPLILLFLLYILMYKQNFSYYSIAIVVIFFLNFLLESMLERHAGVMTFSFITCLLLIKNNDN
jgi:O-antigen ligase